MLFTDQYQLTMAQLYFRQGLHERPAQFDHFYRSNPDYGNHQAGYCVAAGLGPLLDWMGAVRFGDQELEALRAQHGPDGRPRFDEDFLGWLRDSGGFGSLRLRAVPEGRVVHPHEPLVSVEGPFALAQLLETALLNHLNHPTLIASKASRIVTAARGGAVLEFGMRRGATWGVNPAARAALIGGAVGTSNVGMSSVLGTDPKGTHAHSMVQAYLALGHGELEAFRAYAAAFPDECILLVDTVDTLRSGVPNAITVFDELRAAGHAPVGVRLDSGDLAHLAVRTAALLDEAGHAGTTIVLSGDLDELAIWQILTQIHEEAPDYGLDPADVVGRLAYGVGTRLITSEGEPALGGVYKLVSIADEGGEWRPAVKISQSPAKIPLPGRKRVWRVSDGRGLATVDVVSLIDEDPPAVGGPDLALHHPTDASVSRTLAGDGIAAVEELLVDVWADGHDLTGRPDLEELRRRHDDDVARLDAGVRRLVNPHVYHVSMTRRLAETRRQAIADARNT